MARLRVVRRQGAVEQIRYRKADDGLRYKHDTEAPTDLFLVDVDGKKGSLVLPRGNADGWERDGGTTWLTNKPARSRRSSMAAQRTKRRPPRGYKSWKTYMASIRPNGSKKRKARRSSTASGGTGMARKRSSKRRKSTKRATTRRRSVVVYAANKPKRRRHTYRRNGTSLMRRGRGIVAQTMDLAIGGLVGGATVVVGEATSRLVRSRVFSEPAGTAMAAIMEGATAIAGGLTIEIAGKRRPRAQQFAHDFVAGGFAAIIRSMLRPYAVTHPIINEALADGGRRIIPRRAVSSFAKAPAMGSWPRGGRRALGAGGSAGISETDRELGYA